MITPVPCWCDDKGMSMSASVNTLTSSTMKAWPGVVVVEAQNWHLPTPLVHQYYPDLQIELKETTRSKVQAQTVRLDPNNNNCCNHCTALIARPDHTPVLHTPHS